MTYPSEADVLRKYQDAGMTPAPPPPDIPYTPPTPANPPPSRTTAGDYGLSPEMYAQKFTAPDAPSPTSGTNSPTPASGGGYWVQVPINGSDGKVPGGGTGTGGSGNPPPPSTGNAALDALLAVLSYGGDVYQSIPALQYIMGQLSEGQFNSVTTQDTVVPQLGITLPAPGKLNYQMLNNVKQNSPGSFELLKSLFAAGNRDLDNEMAITRQAAPLGSAWEGSLIQT